MTKNSASLVCLLIGTIICATPVKSSAAGVFNVNYSSPTYLGFSLGFDQDQQHPITLEKFRNVDLNGDGKEDVVFSTNARGLAQINPMPFKVLMSNGNTLIDKTSELFSIPPKAQWIRDIHIADFNGDGKPDIFSSNHGTEAIQPFPGEQNWLFLSTPSGIFADDSLTNLPRQTDFSHGSSVGDVDGDGDIDIFVNNLGEDEGHPSALLLNDGIGKFTVVAEWRSQNVYLPPEASTLWGPYWTHMFDMDGDGFPDIYVQLNQPGVANPNRYLVNDGAGHFSFSHQELPTFTNYPTNLVQASSSCDVNRDGKEDLLLFDTGGMSGSGPTVIQVLINKGGGVFASESWRLPSIPKVYGAPDFSVIDLDGDGAPDIFVKRWDEEWQESGFALLNDGKGNFSLIPQDKLPNVSPHYAVLDINGDGVMDFLSDQTWKPDWSADHNNQFKIIFGRIDVPLVRMGWETDDTIAGGSQDDVLYGMGGNDVLKGNGGNDTLYGGPGNDTLIGGTGADIFVFKTEDGLGNCPNCDTIIDFETGIDKIDLSDIDAQAGVAGKQLFTFIGAKEFSSRVGELRVCPYGADTLMEADTNGDANADFSIRLKGAIKITRNDLIFARHSSTPFLQLLLDD